MPLLPGGDTDLQRAIHQAVSNQTVRLVGADGSERQITSPLEIGIGLSSLRLAKLLPPEPVKGGTGDADDDSTGTGGAEPSGTGSGGQGGSTTARNDK